MPSAEAAPPRPTIAAFDVDGTVTVRDCVVPFLRRVAGTVPLAARVGTSRRTPMALARRDRDALKAVAARAAFAGRPAADIETAGRAFAADIARAGLRGDTVARLRWHQAQGHETVFVSASFAAYLRPLADALGVDAVLGTELVVDADGRCTGDLDGANCRGAEKVARLHAWLEEHHGGRAAVELWVYGDSAGDRELLADADHAVWVAGPLAAAPATGAGSRP